MRSLVVLMVLSIANISFAEEKKVTVTMREGDNIIVSGKAYPGEVLNELKEAKRALQKARMELNKEVRLVNKNKEDLKTFKNEMDEQQDRLRNFVNKVANNTSLTKEEVNKLYSDLMRLRRDLEFKFAVTSVWLDTVVGYVKYLNLRVQRLEEKQWYISLHALVNFEWNTDTNNWTQFNMLGVSGMFMNSKMLLSLDVSAGLNSLTEQFSWAMGASTEYRLTDTWSLGGSVLLGQDLGDMEGAEMLSGSLGPVLRYMHLGGDWTSFSVSLSPCRIGPQGKKEETFNSKPNWYPNFSGLLTLDYFVL